MACSKCPPVARIKKETDSTTGVLSLLDDSSFYDSTKGCTDEDRRGEWVLTKNGTEVYRSPYDTLTTPIPIGEGSTCKDIILPNGSKDLADFLIAEGVPCVTGDVIGISRVVENCCGLESKKASEECEIVIEVQFKECPVSIVDDKGTAVDVATINYSLSCFDLTVQGGAIESTFDVLQQFLMNLTALTGFDYEINEDGELVKLIPEGEDCPATVETIVIIVATKCETIIAGDAVDATDGTITYPATFTFDTTETTVADEAELLTAFVGSFDLAANPSQAEYTAADKNLSAYMKDDTVCLTETITVTAPIYDCVISLVDKDGVKICPADFATYQFNLTDLGGNNNEMFADGNELATRVIALTFVGWAFMATSCELQVSSNEVCPTVTEIVATAETRIPILSTKGIPICPVDFTNGNFNLTDFGGADTVLLADAAALVAEVNTLTNETEWAYDAVTCELYIFTENPPAVTSIVYSINLACICDDIIARFNGMANLGFLTNATTLEVEVIATGNSFATDTPLNNPLDVVIDWGDGNIITYPGSLSTSNQFSTAAPAHTYAAAGIYVGTLSLVGENGLTFSHQFILDTDSQSSPFPSLVTLFANQDNCPDLTLRVQAIFANMNTAENNLISSELLINFNSVFTGVNFGLQNIVLQDVEVGTTNTMDLITVMEYKGTEYTLTSSREFIVECN